ncbi:MAG TPA: hypothetical protein VGA36_05930 [Nitriliruptorales bacterium]|jgi:hypothetical protein
MPATRRTDGRDEHVDDREAAARDTPRDTAGVGEVIAALVLIGTLLLIVWAVAAAGLVEDGVPPSVPDDLGAEVGGAD